MSFQKALLAAIVKSLLRGKSIIQAILNYCAAPLTITATRKTRPAKSSSRKIQDFLKEAEALLLGPISGDGLIGIGHGRITLPDRARAETGSCECHAAVRRHFEEVMGAVYAPGGRIVAVDVAEPERLRAPSALVKDGSL